MPSGLRVLVLDDEETVAAFFVALLTQNGCRCETAFCVADGLESAERFRPDVILFDLDMPGDGRRLPGLLGPRRPVLIAASGSLTGETDQQLRADGVEHVLQKPFPSSILLDILRGCPSRPRRIVAGPG